ncbi:MAG TPA: ATP-binding cassette domain-containing protein [Sediminibacterium sp.]|nr:ATP-binding cassette domain-containing protein [Sediminibacterium sp.]
MHKLEADSIQLSFDERKILSDIYLKVETGKITGLLGRNGEGKSSLLKIIYGSMAAEKSIRFDNQSEHFAYQRTDLIKYLPQFNFIPKHLSLKRVFQDFEIDYSQFEQQFDTFKSKSASTIESLSGGEHRLVELYVILKSKAQFALLDEPFTHLSPIQIEQVKTLIQEEKANKGLIITDHLYQDVIGICDKLYVLANGKTYLASSLNDLEKIGYASV